MTGFLRPLVLLVATHALLLAKLVRRVNLDLSPGREVLQAILVEKTNFFQQLSRMQ